MLFRWHRTKYLLVFAVSFACLHALFISRHPPPALKVSYPFLIVAPLFAAGACLRRARSCGLRMRFAWMMIGVSLILWSEAMLVSALEYFSIHAIGNIAGLSDLMFLLYAVPILLVLLSPIEGQRSVLFLWLEALQAIIAGCLVYVSMFSRLPFQNQPPTPISMPLVVNTYNVVNFGVAIVATLRLQLHSRAREEGRMLRVLACYLWLYAMCAALNNAIVAKLGDRTGCWDLLGDVSCLALWVLVVSLPFPSRKVAKTDVRERLSSRPLARYLDNASPVAYTAVLLVLSAMNVRQHFVLGMVGIGLSLAVYAVRSTMLQNRFIRSELRLREAHDRLEQLSLQDGLTGAGNRRSFDLTLVRCWETATQKEEPLSLLLIDLDHFKNLNDRYGHRFGDQCLVQVAAELKQMLPASNHLLARYGGEEFAAILADTSGEDAVALALRMRESIRALGLDNEGSVGNVVTVSIGVSTYSASGVDSAEALVEAADKALYRAKLGGRDRVEFAEAQDAEVSWQ